MQTNKTPEFWWTKEDDNAAATEMFGLVEQLKSDQGSRETDLRYWLSLYVNRNLASLSGRDYLSPARLAGERERLSINVVESCIDTVANRLDLNKPKPFFATSAATWEEKQRAKALNKFMDGLFYECRIAEDIQPAVRLDALWSGSGVAKVCDENDRVKVEWVHPLDLTVDPGEAKHGKPRSIYQDAVVSRSVAIATWGEGESGGKETPIIEMILKADGPESDGEATRADLVVIREGWHLASKKGANDGKHIVAVSTGALLVEDYDEEDFPFEVLHYKRRPMGFWGGGMAEELSGIQTEMNYTTQKIQRMLKMNSSRTFMRRQARVPKTSVTNEAGAIIECDDPTDVKTVADNAVPPEFFNHTDRLYEWSFQKAGVSMLAATGKKPAGLDSEPAQRAYNDTTNERFAKFLGNDEKFAVGLGNKMVACMQRIAKRKKGSYTVRLAVKGKLKMLDWKEVQIDEDKRVLQCLPISSLPTQPAQRLQTISEWISMGWIDAEKGRDLMNMPDLDDATSLAVAALHDIEATISAILEDGHYTDPEKYQNLQLGLKMMTSAYLRARMDGAPEEKLTLMRQWIDAASEMLNPPAPPMPAALPVPDPMADPMAAMGAPAPAMPMPPVGPPMPPVVA